MSAVWSSCGGLAGDVVVSGLNLGLCGLLRMGVSFFHTTLQLLESARSLEHLKV